MLQSKGRYSLDCINDVTCGSVWGTITTLENIDEAVQQREHSEQRSNFTGFWKNTTAIVTHFSRILEEKQKITTS